MKLKAMLFVLAVSVLMVAALPAAAADLNGSFVVKIESPRGTFETTYTFKVDGKKLTGTVAGRGGETPIKDGSVDGAKFTFSVERQGRDGNTMTTTYNGVLDGDTISLKWKQGENDREAKGDRKK